MSFFSCCRWFEAFVLRWLEENEKIALDLMVGALERDQNNGVSFILCSEFYVFCFHLKNSILNMFLLFKVFPLRFLVFY